MKHSMLSSKCNNESPWTSSNFFTKSHEAHYLCASSFPEDISLTRVTPPNSPDPWKSLERSLFSKPKPKTMSFFFFFFRFQSIHVGNASLKKSFLVRQLPQQQSRSDNNKSEGRSHA
ncbi:hypothetical protein ACOSQ4_013275 [Xanthoceras sorbifolium]